MAVKLQTKDAYRLFHQGTLALADVERNGVKIDIDYCVDAIEEIEEEKAQLLARLRKTELGKRWKKVYGRVHYTNNVELADILYNRMGIKPIKTTKAKKPSTDEDTLSKLSKKVEGLDLILQIRKIEKSTGTYLSSILNECDDEGYMHPSFNLNLVSTFRSSSSNPNFQNVPIRDPKFGKVIRSAFIPRKKGWQIGEGDYSGLEVHIGACYHHDKRMIEYLTDPTKDMHRDMAGEIFMLKKDQIGKGIRYHGKNGFVFPQFYGSYFKECAANLWYVIQHEPLKLENGMALKAWIAKKGITCLEDFEDHIEKVEHRFWKERFRQYDKWRQQRWREYQRDGYFDCHTGFRFQGSFDRNQVINYPVQGSAFHCLLWSLIQMNREMKRKKMESVIIGQIHDSIVYDLHPAEVDDVFHMARCISDEKLREHWKWVTLPLEVEFDLCPPDQSWFSKKEYKLAA